MTDDIRAVVVKTKESMIRSADNYKKRVNLIRKLISPTVDHDKYHLEHLHNIKSYDVIFLIYPRNKVLPNHTIPIRFDGGMIRRIPCEELSLHIRKQGHICADKDGRMWRIVMNPKPRHRG